VFSVNHYPDSSFCFREVLTMLCGQVFERFATKSPVTVMLRGVLEHALAPDALDQLFAATAQRQYTRELLFSTTVDLLVAVACRMYPAVHAAYQDDADRLGVTVRALYDKLARMEPTVGEALVRHTAAQLKPVLQQLGATLPPLVPGYTTKILDGNHLAASQRRLGELRDVAAGPLPGQTLVVLEPEYQLASAVLCCEDGHAQERSRLDRVLAHVQAKDLWVADRNFCTTGFLFALARRRARFVMRQHGSTLHWEREGPRRRVGEVPEGVVYEQPLWLEDGHGRTLRVRRVTLVLHQPTQDGDTELHLLTNLPARIGAKRITQVYRQRWTIEHLFLNLTTILRCEMNTLAYPKAALFSFCAALVGGNLLATLKGALRAAHGATEVTSQVSDYQLAVEVRGKYLGMMVALPPAEWQEVGTWSVAQMTRWLRQLAKRVDLARFAKHPRGPKQPRPRRTRFAQAKHVATARLLAQERHRK
jgi:hypothetical protein